MEGLAVTGQVSGLVSSLGIVPTLVICVLTVFFVVRELKKENASTRKSISDLMERSDAKDRGISDDVDEVRSQLASMQREFITKEEHYRDLEGWKSEISELRKAVADLPIEIIKLTRTIKGE